MSEGRSAILGRISRQIDARDGTSETQRRESVLSHLKGQAETIVPASGRLSGKAAIDQFIAKAEAVNSTVERVPEVSGLPEAVARYLAGNGLARALRRGADPLWESVDWSQIPELRISVGPSDGSDIAGISVAHSAIAETGTLVLCSGPDNPTTLNFLPEHHIVVLPVDRIEGALEKPLRDIVAAADADDEPLPRVINLTTGPSRSADIEQTLILGAHGPRALHIILVGTQ